MCSMFGSAVKCSWMLKVAASMSLILGLQMVEFSGASEKWIERWPWEHFTKADRMQQLELVDSRYSLKAQTLASQWRKMLHKELCVEGVLNWLVARWGEDAGAWAEWRRALLASEHPTTTDMWIDAMMSHFNSDQ